MIQRSWGCRHLILSACGHTCFEIWLISAVVKPSAQPTSSTTSSLVTYSDTALRYSMTFSVTIIGQPSRLCQWAALTMTTAALSDCLCACCVYSGDGRLVDSHTLSERLQFMRTNYLISALTAVAQAHLTVDQQVCLQLLLLVLGWSQLDFTFPCATHMSSSYIQMCIL